MLINDYCRQASPFNKRRFIEGRIPTNEIEYDVNGTKYTNLVCTLNTDQKISLTISAHYDVVNYNYENCLDNSASVVNLIKLYNRLKSEKLRYNVSLAFID